MSLGTVLLCHVYSHNNPRLCLRTVCITHAGGQSVEGSCRQDAGGRRGVVRVLLAAAVRRQRANLIRSAAGPRPA